MSIHQLEVLKLLLAFLLMPGTWSETYGHELHTHENPVFYLALQLTAYS